MPVLFGWIASIAVCSVVSGPTMDRKSTVSRLLRRTPAGDAERGRQLVASDLRDWVVKFQNKITRRWAVVNSSLI